MMWFFETLGIAIKDHLPHTKGAKFSPSHQRFSLPLLKIMPNKMGQKTYTVYMRASVHCTLVSLMCHYRVTKIAQNLILN